MKNNVQKPKKKNVHEGHRSRLKETYLKHGTDSFYPHTMLEMLLFFAIPYKDTNEIAHELINKFGGLAGVFEADIPALKSVKNMTVNAAILIKLISDISKLYLTAKPTMTDRPASLQDIKSFFMNKYSGETTEKVYLIFLDKNDKIINCTQTGDGNAFFGNVNISKIVKEAHERNATKAIIAHNHPDGSDVSSNDVVASRQLAFHLKSVGIELLFSYLITRNKLIDILKMDSIKNI